MTLGQAAVLGIVQGLTEFLPVSSTAHLVIVQNLFRLKGPILLVFDVVVHLGTLASLLVYFGKNFFAREIERPKHILWLVILATIPTGIIGFLLKDWMEEYFNSLSITVITLLLNSLILWSTRWIPGRAGKEISHWLDAVWIGIAQGISILPGISRSGATISTALWLRIKAEDAAWFSFLIAIPAILGATVVVLPESLRFFSIETWPILATGFIAAFFSGYLAILVLFRVMLRGQFHLFALYTFVLAIVTSFFSFSK